MDYPHLAMTRPHIIRADTIDLQKGASPASSSSVDPDTANSTLRPHQAETLREVAQETAEESLRTPRVSWNGPRSGENAAASDASDVHDLATGIAASVNSGTGDTPNKKMQQQDALAVAQNGGLQDDSDLDTDGDESLDDDMMDKISSSPSIEDGWCAPIPLPPRSWPRRVDSLSAALRPARVSCSPAADADEARSSSAGPYSPSRNPPGQSIPERSVTSVESFKSTLSEHRDHRTRNHPTGKYEPEPRADADTDRTIDEHPPINEEDTTTDEAASDSTDENGPIDGYEAGLWRGDKERRSGLSITDERGHARVVVRKEQTGIGAGCNASPDTQGMLVRYPADLDEGEPYTRRKLERIAEEDEAIGGISEDETDYDATGERYRKPLHRTHDDFLTIPYETISDGDASDDDCDDDDNDDSLLFPDDPRYVDTGWGHECLRDTEDIDFEFVYALHTFVATVEGQANATKGDNMVLLDDSNSYWWLVKVVKDSSIGYLPAEHIETPTERLARLNKHRNIDLSAAMLGDQAEKLKPTFKAAIRRRKKTVTFAAPTYVDYSDFDYSTDEEDPEEVFAQQQLAAQQQQQQKQKQREQENASAGSSQPEDDSAMEDDTAKVEPLNTRAQKDSRVSEVSSREETKADVESRRSSEDMFKAETPGRSRNGTVRNTDSFFKDDTVETKKITLTPNLLRDDNTPRGSTDSKEIRQRPSLDKLDKELVSDKAKDDKKRKEKEKKEKDKKPSVIRNFFSRKDKKKTAEDEDDLSGPKKSMESGSDAKESLEELEEVSSEKALVSAPKASSGKLQKQQPKADPSPTRRTGPGLPLSSSVDMDSYISEPRNDVSNVPPTSMRIVEPDRQERRPSDTSSDAARSATAAVSVAPTRRSSSAERTGFSSKTSRAGLDDFEAIDEEAPAESNDTSPVEPSQEKAQQLAPASASAAATKRQMNETGGERLSESPVHISPVTSNNPPALILDTSSQEDHSNSPSPELIDASEAEEGMRHRNQDSMTTSSVSTGASSTPSMAAWDDVKLRAFFDSSTDIRDMLMVVYDKTDVAPAGPDHPVAGMLFREQNAKLAEITTQLDNMLGDWLARKQRLRGTL